MPQRKGPVVYPKPDARERSKHAAEIRKPGPVRRLSPDEIRAMEHKRNLERFLAKQRLR